MTAMHPASGVPPEDARNSLPNDVEASVNCDELWYSTSRCQPRFDPAAANAMLAELITLINKGEVVYDCNHLDQVQYAVRYITQRGLPRACLFKAGPSAFLSGLDPQCTRYNDFMTLTIIPNVDNQNAVTLDLNDLGPRQILRNDGEQLKSKDLKAYKPEIIAYWAGSWYVCGLVASQVLQLSPALDFWIRTDGNDLTGDGTANSADKAFKTIAGCWAAVGSRYAATPSFAINMRFGIPGIYDGAAIGPFGGRVSLTGDPANPAGYRIANWNTGAANIWASLWIQSISSMNCKGVTFLIERAPPSASIGVRIINSNAAFENCRFEASTSNGTGGIMVECVNGQWGTGAGNCVFAGNSNQINVIFSATGLSSCVGAYLDTGERSNYYFENINVIGTSMNCSALSTMHWGSASSFNITNVVGNQYSVIENSIINMGGKPVIGTIAGAMGSGGRFIP